MCKSRVLIVSICVGTVLWLAPPRGPARSWSATLTPEQLHLIIPTVHDGARAGDRGGRGGSGSAVDGTTPGRLAQATTFRTLCVVAAAGVVGLLLLCRHRHMTSVMRARFDVAFAERTRIARELHDTLLQGFTGVTLQLHGVQRTLASRPEDAVAMLSRALDNAHATLRSARRVVWDIRSPELDEQSLTDALAGAGRQAIVDARTELRFTVRGNPRRLPHAAEIATLCIGREAVMNAARHADARIVELELRYKPRTIELIVRDDGRGFMAADLESARRNGHWGVIGMRERAASLGGTFEIESAPGGGTRVSVAIPVIGASA